MGDEYVELKGDLLRDMLGGSLAGAREPGVGACRGAFWGGETGRVGKVCGNMWPHSCIGHIQR